MNEPGGGWLEPTSVEIERSQLIVEIDVHPFIPAACACSVASLTTSVAMPLRWKLPRVFVSIRNAWSPPSATRLTNPTISPLAARAVTQPKL